MASPWSPAEPPAIINMEPLTKEAGERIAQRLQERGVPTSRKEYLKLKARERRERTRLGLTLEQWRERKKNG